jgi:hypothetical protein
MIWDYLGEVYILIINQLLSIASFIAIGSFNARDLMQLLAIRGAASKFWAPGHPSKLAGWD